MANGAELELIHNPLYDDREINFEIDPITGYPTESMRFTFLDFSDEGNAVPGNIKYMKRKGANDANQNQNLVDLFPFLKLKNEPNWFI